MAAPLLHDRDYLERILTRAIASAFEGCGEAWHDDTSGDRLAEVAAHAVSRQLIEAGVKIRDADSSSLTAPQHRRAAEELLSEASFRTSGGVPTTRAGFAADIEALRLLVARAQVHALLAALPPTREEDER